MSQSQGATTQIGGVSYEVLHLPPDDAILLSEDLVRVGGNALITALVKLVGPAALDKEQPSPEAKAETALEEDPQEVINGVGEVLRDLVARYDGKAWLRLVEAMMRVTSADGKPMYVHGAAAWKLHFQGRMGELRQVVLFALGVNFGGFFGAGQLTLGSAIGRAMGATTHQA